MAGVGKRLRLGSAASVACALCFCASPATASDLSLFAPGNLQLIGDVRLVALDGEKSWVDGGFGKLRSSGGGNDVRVRRQSTAGSARKSVPLLSKGRSPPVSDSTSCGSRSRRWRQTTRRARC